MGNESYEIVAFGDHHIMAMRQGGDVLVVMKPISEALGLAWHGQLERIKRHPAISKGVRVIRVPSLGGMQDATALALEHFHV